MQIAFSCPGKLLSTQQVPQGCMPNYMQCSSWVKFCNLVKACCASTGGSQLQASAIPWPVMRASPQTDADRFQLEQMDSSHMFSNALVWYQTFTQSAGNDCLCRHDSKHRDSIQLQIVQICRWSSRVEFQCLLLARVKTHPNPKAWTIACTA